VTESLNRNNSLAVQSWTQPYQKIIRKPQQKPQTNCCIFYNHL